MKLCPVACLPCLFAAAAMSCAQSLQNASFEDQGEAGDAAAHWRQWGALLNRETDRAPAATGSAMIGYHHREAGDSNTSGIWQDIPDVKAGERFKFSVQVWRDKTENGAPVDQVELRLETTRGSGQVLIASAAFAPNDIPADDQWRQISVTGTTPESDLRVLIIVTPSSEPARAGAVKFDDAALEVLPAQDQRASPASTR